MTRHFALMTLCLIPVLAACAPYEPSPGARQAAAQRLCARDGGRWEHHGGMLREGRMCVFYYRDEGRSCTDNSQCRGGCFTDDAPPAPDAQVAGRCARDNRAAGHCRAPVENGRAGQMMCAD